MANEKSNINELVSHDDDPTSELDLIVLHQEDWSDDVELESAANTCGFGANSDGNEDASIAELKSDLRSRSETINRLQFDIEQLRGKWMGLETEISARETITDKLNEELAELKATLSRKDKLLKKRNQSIRSLKAETLGRRDEQRVLQDAIAGLRDEIVATNDASQAEIGALQATISSQKEEIVELRHDSETLAKFLEDIEEDGAQKNRVLLSQQAGQLASNDVLINELRERFERSEKYADALRQQLQDREANDKKAEGTQNYLQQSLARAEQQLSELQTTLDAETASRSELQKQLDGLQQAHSEEIKMIRFELGEAQETVALHESIVAEHETMNEQLAADLCKTRGTRLQLEEALNQVEGTHKLRVEKLERENQKLLTDAKDFEQKLATRTEAINVLLAELAKKTEQIESIGEIENVIHEIDNRMSKRIDGQSSGDRDRVTRVLIGSVEGQELRFPLFKSRLTIGRTQQNDIQLKASYISRRHAVVVTDGDATRIIDWGSKNGVYVNSRRVTEHFLKNRDVVAIGNAAFRYEERPKRDA